MATESTSDGSEDVKEFLRRIKELGDKREREDDERARKLEQDILEGRRQREARRAERARSLSPEKQSPSATPQSVRSPQHTTRTETLPSSPLNSDRSKIASDALDTIASAHTTQSLGSQRSTTESQQVQPSLKETTSSASGTRETVKSSITPRPAPLSWQQRPSSLQGRRSRPLSMIEKTSKEQLQSKDEGSDNEEATPSRNNIAQALATKDPSWFKQTPDRGIGSAAYKRSAENIGDLHTVAPGKMKLHGMSTERSSLFRPDPQTSQIDSGLERLDVSRPATAKLTSPSVVGNAALFKSMPAAEEHARSSEPSSPLGPSHVAHSSSFEQNQIGARLGKFSLDSDPAASQSQSRALPENPRRSPSPSKGLGGFVQSAMLRRSDSLTKRGNAQSSAGQIGYNLPASSPKVDVDTLGTRPGPESLEPRAIDRDSTKDAREISQDSFEYRQTLSSGSANSTTTLDSPRIQNTTGVTGQTTAKPSAPAELLQSGNFESETSKENTSPPSPSKRWSPVKSSWIESALNKPETPRHKSGNSQPSWMAELNRGKQERASRELNTTENAATKSASKHVTPAKPNEDQSRREEFGMRITSSTEATPSATTALDAPTGVVEQPIALVSTGNEGSLKGSAASATSFNSKQAPATPPKRSAQLSSKPSNTPSEASTKEQLEFQNVFGKLRRTQTEKYVAPDELKNNILRGKAALNLSGGPQKNPVRDEFKESLLQQKEAMKSKAAESKDDQHGSGSTTPAKDELSNVPEAIAKRRALGSQSGNIQSPRTSEKSDAFVASQGLSSAQNMPKSLPGHSERNELQVQPQKATTTAGTGKLAGRFNPGLASIIARGPPTFADKASASGVESSTVSRETDEERAPKPHVSNHSLQHMTKDRARGPKRRTPKAAGVNVQNKPPVSENTVLSTLSLDHKSGERVTTSDEPEAKPSLAQTATRHSSAPFEPRESSPSLDLKAARSPPVPSKPSKLTESPSNHKEFYTAETKIGMRNTENSVKNAAAMWDAPIKSTSAVTGTGLARGQTKSSGANTLPQKDREWIAGNTGRSESNGLGLNMGTVASTNPSVVIDNETPQKPTKPVRSLEERKEAPKTPASEQQTMSPKAQTLGSSPIPQTSEASRLFSEFFDTMPVNHGSVEVDTSAILSSNAARTSKTKTIHNQIREIASDGKLAPVSPHQEHVLFSGCMYLCIHVFSSEGASSFTEAYFWIGNEVPSAAAEDAYIFARKTAKENNASLIKLPQGKETPEFLQALGGIMVSRHGDSKNASSSYILCGRQHLGHMAFDEVPFALKSLCSGFPFILSSGSGNLFIWKGNGCNAEELGCARLIGMDLEPNSAVVEIDEGRESPEFLSVFPATSSSSIKSAEFWKLKPKHENYRVRLFHIEHGIAPAESMASAIWQKVSRASQQDSTSANHTQVTEIIPFCQDDVRPENIYVLDAFFEIYILLGAESKGKPQSFVSALHFAQEYGILAASSEDRPFVPVTTVVLEGAPKDMKSCFRQWNQASEPIVAGQPKRGRSLRIVPLSAAIAATKVT